MLTPHAPLYSALPRAGCIRPASKALRHRIWAKRRHMATGSDQIPEAATAKITLIRPDAPSINKLWSQSLTSGSKKTLETRLLFPSAATSAPELNALVSLGSEFAKKDVNVRREIVRKAAGTGIEKVKGVASSTGVKSIAVSLEEAKVGEDDIHAAGDWFAF